VTQTTDPGDEPTSELADLPAAPAVPPEPTDPADVPPPMSSRSLQLMFYAVVAQIVFSLGYSATYASMTSTLRHAVITSNTKAKSPKTLCSVSNVKGCLNVDKVVHSLQEQTILVAVVFSLLIAVLGWRVRQGRRTGRTFFVVASVFAGFVGYAGSPVGLLAILAAQPAVSRGFLAIAALASIAAVVLAFRPDASAYFNVISPRPVTAAAVGGGWRGLFSPRGVMSSPRSISDQPTSGVRSSAQSRAQARVAKSKSRNDAEAIARGAEIARQRAKASKSRRNDLG
jgi:hypothetical protein